MSEGKDKTAVEANRGGNIRGDAVKLWQATKQGIIELYQRKPFYTGTNLNIIVEHVLHSAGKPYRASSRTAEPATRSSLDEAYHANPRIVSEAHTKRRVQKYTQLDVNYRGQTGNCDYCVL